MSSKRISGEAAQKAQPVVWRYVRTPAVDGLAAALPRLYGDPGRARDDGHEEEEKGPPLEEQLRLARERGYREGEAAASEAARARLDAAVSQLASAIGELAGYRSRLRRDAERDLVGLAMAIARRILRREVTIDPEAVLGVVKAALERMDAREVYRIRLHPDEVGLLGRRMESVGLGRNVELAADPAVGRGGAILETAHGAVDATIEGQLQEIERGFADWMERK